MTRLMRDLRALEPEQRVAGGAAVALFVTMLLPWYQQNAIVNAPKAAPLQSRNLNAFQVFSFVEAAVLLVAVAVIYLLYARAEGREFHLPGGDGTVVFAAGIWTALLLILRLFDKPGISSHGVAANVGVQWGIFFALAAAGALAYAGSRMRAARRPEPPLARRNEEPPRARSAAEPPQARRSEQPPQAPRSEQPPQAPRSEQPLPETTRRPRYPPPPPTMSSRAVARRPVAAAKAAEQLSFEDPPPEPGHHPA
jgi:hypothetical protein